MGTRQQLMLMGALVAVAVPGCASPTATAPPTITAAPASVRATTSPSVTTSISPATMVIESPSSGPVEKASITVGVLPIVDVAPVYLAQSEGLFEDVGLTVSTELMQGGAAAIPALQGGDLDVAYGAWPSFLVANQNGVDLVAVADGVSATPGYTEFLASADSGLGGNPGSIAGQTVALNTLGNIGELALRYMLQNAGLTFGDVTAVEIPFPDMGAALDSGSADVIWISEPGVSANKSDLGAVTVVDSYVGDMEGFPVAGYFVTRDFAEQYPNTVAAFANAVQAAADMGNADPTVIQSTVTDYTTLPQALVAQLHYPEYHGTLDPAVLQRVYDFMQQFDLIDPGLDVSSLVLSTAQ